MLAKLSEHFLMFQEELLKMRGLPIIYPGSRDTSYLMPHSVIFTESTMLTSFFPEDPNAGLMHPQFYCRWIPNPTRSRTSIPPNHWIIESRFPEEFELDIGRLKSIAMPTTTIPEKWEDLFFRV